MNTGKKLKSGLLLLLFSFLLQACSSSIPNLSDVKHEIIDYYKTGRYDAELNGVIDKAVSQFDKVSVMEKSLVVFDIDETALSNYQYERQVDFGYTGDTWNKWMEDAKAPAIAGVKKLYDYLLNRGFKIAFVTGRPEIFYNATYKNLVSAGYKTFDTLIVRNTSEEKLTAQEYKSKKRLELTAKGYDITGDVGDQYSDLEGPDHGIQVKIPNYMYLIK